MNGSDGIFELLTPAGEGGIAVFGLEGPGVREALAIAVRSRRISALSPGDLAYGRLLDEDGATLDEVIVACLTGRGDAERFELNCHAGGAAARATADRLGALGLHAGTLPPEKDVGLPESEFRAMLRALRTRRQVEALADARLALDSELAGIIGLLGSGQHRSQARAALEKMLEESSRLQALLKTHRAVIIGPANAGKSTLFNRLAGADRAITSPHPGTTRDTVEACVSLNGVSVQLADTAGLGSGLGALAERSQELSRGAAGDADLLLLVLDGCAPPKPEVTQCCAELLKGSPRAILVLNKLDAGEPKALPADLSGPGARPARVSALTGEGLPGLLEVVEAALLPSSPTGAAAVCGQECLSNLRRAYACAEKASVENDPSAARAAVAILEKLRETPV